ncbi:uncharacterized protein DNG_07946 [Cephalotrichum gorgonifer]|uniref:DUF1742-domain-containing protein n=1 Tax=Cephalotrichum gorgonifer TaxID=2041049 RepID=A0AAE8N4D0_9PEZI|nr:uncharacterized protein DNG_07946 [Cephalotrichum gorgonifer]
MPFENVYAHRKVADTAQKGCDICYRPTTSVLISDGPDGKDFFFVCPAHIKDRKFCSPIIDQDAVEARKKKAMEEELERVKKEYEEKKRKKEAEKKKKDEEKEKEKEKEKSGDKSKDEEKDKSKDKDNKDGTDEVGAGAKKSEASAATLEEEPRFFALQRVFYNQRLAKKREAEMARRNRERLQQPNLFPSVPKNLPGT